MGKFKITETRLKGCCVIEPTIFKDERGSFSESFNRRDLQKEGIDIDIYQENKSISNNKNIIRGMHFQYEPYAQAKLVRCEIGEILDVVVDLRINSSTYGQWIKVLLTGENGINLYVPKGFAHGYQTLSDYSIFNYKVDNYYDKESEDSILWNDSTLNILWSENQSYPILSEKDMKSPLFDKNKVYFK